MNCSFQQPKPDNTWRYCVGNPLSQDTICPIMHFCCHRFSSQDRLLLSTGFPSRTEKSAGPHLIKRKLKGTGLGDTALGPSGTTLSKTCSLLCQWHERSQQLKARAQVSSAGSISEVMLHSFVCCNQVKVKLQDGSA